MRGSIRQRGARSWELRVYAGRDDLTGRKTYVHRTVQGTRRDADTELARLVSDFSRGTHARPRSGTVGELLTQWFELNDADWSPSVVRGYRAILDRHLFPRFGDTPLKQLRTAELDHYYATLRKRGGEGGRPLSAATVRRVHAVLRTALAQGVKWGLLPLNPASNASPPREPRRQVAPPSPDDVIRLVEAADARKPALGCFLRLAAVTGGRRGELCALRWEHLDPGRNQLVIERSIVEGPGLTLVEKDTKTHSSRRLRLDPETIDRLRRHKTEQRELLCLLGARQTNDLFIFCHPEKPDLPWRPGYVTLAFNRLRVECGLERVRLHDLRHFAATTMLVAGSDIRTVSGRLGHADASTTLGVYAHFIESADDAASDALASALRGPPDQRRRRARSR